MSSNENIHAVCRYFLFGTCQDGARCKFLHTRPDSLSQLTNSQGPISNSFVKVERICQAMVLGRCPDGPEKCLFLHSEDMKTPLLDPGVNLGASITPLNVLQQKHKGKEIFYKTKVCRYIASGKPCPNAQYCTYMHPGDQKHIPTKRLPCKNFQEKGWCPQGDKCIYLHPKDLGVNPNFVQEWSQLQGPGLKRKPDTELRNDAVKRGRPFQGIPSGAVVSSRLGGFKERLAKLQRNDDEVESDIVFEISPEAS